MMAGHSYRVTFADGTVRSMAAASAAQVRRVYPDAVKVERADTPEPRPQRTAWDIHSGRLPW